jgi:DNA-binding transcriptional LysR family regulator
MDTTRLELFMDLAQTRNFSATAKKFYRTQPAVSIAIRRLEEDLGVPLLERKSGPVRLTAEGEALQKSAAEVLMLVKDFRFQASLLAKHPKGLVRVATTHSVGLHELSDPIGSFIKRYRDIRLELRYVEAERVYSLVESRSVDFGVVAYPGPTRTIEVLPMMESELVIISPPSRFRGKDKLSLSELDGEDLVAFPPEALTRRAVDRALLAVDARPVVRFEDSNIETLKKAVEVGIGSAIVPRTSVAKERSGRFRVMKIHGAALYRPIGLLKLKAHRLSLAANLFAEELLTRPKVK